MKQIAELLAPAGSVETMYAAFAEEAALEREPMQTMQRVNHF